MLRCRANLWCHGNHDVSASDTVLITGGGPVGLGGVVNAKYRVAKAIIVEPLPYRQQKAKELAIRN